MIIQMEKEIELLINIDAIVSTVFKLDLTYEEKLERAVIELAKSRMEIGERFFKYMLENVSCCYDID